MPRLTARQVLDEIRESLSPITIELPPEDPETLKRLDAVEAAVFQTRELVQLMANDIAALLCMSTASNVKPRTPPTLSKAAGNFQKVFGAELLFETDILETEKNQRFLSYKLPAGYTQTDIIEAQESLAKIANQVRERGGYTCVAHSINGRKGLLITHQPQTQNRSETSEGNPLDT